MKRFSMAITAIVLAVSSPAWSQTPFGSQKPVPATPPGKAQTAPQQPGSVQAAPPQSGGPSSPSSQQGKPPQHSTASPAARVPMPEDMRDQAKFQAEGVFPDMTRPGAGGQIQDAWNKSDPGEGVHVQRLCENCVYKIRTREFMTTTVILPEDAVISSVDPGDQVGFQIKVKSANKLAVRPTSWGMDTNVNVYTKSGAVYPIYVRSETVNSMNIPDLVVKITGKEKPPSIEGISVEHEAKGAENSGKPGDKLAPKIKKTGDFVRHVPVDPAKFHGWGDYKLWGEEELKPETVWRDDFFTYIRYGKKWDGMELSTGYVTIDGIDELVNSHVEGSVFVIESVSPLITLKNGKKYLCIQYTGETP